MGQMHGKSYFVKQIMREIEFQERKGLQNWRISSIRKVRAEFNFSVIFWLK